MPTRWTSRKFLVSLAAQVTALAVLFWPAHPSVIVEASRNITALVVLLASAMTYVHAEASVDRQHRERREEGGGKSAGEERVGP